MDIKIELVSGSEVIHYVSVLTQLRIEVFREWPYLYEGSLEYEKNYLSKFVDMPRSTLILAKDGNEVVGASTAMPLQKAEREFQEPFIQIGANLAQWYYFGESVLKAKYRGQGIGVAFFKFREARAKELGYKYATFCAVDRPVNHPQKPPSYQTLEAFWQKRGFSKRSDLLAFFPWQDIGESTETAKPMIFWVKPL